MLLVADGQALPAVACAAAGVCAAGVPGQLAGVLHAELASKAWILQLAGWSVADLARSRTLAGLAAVAGAAPAAVETALVGLMLPAAVCRRTLSPAGKNVGWGRREQ